jgi:hypothetical protein
LTRWRQRHRPFPDTRDRNCKTSLPGRGTHEKRLETTIPVLPGYFCPTPRKGKIWQKLGCAARPSEDQTPEAGVFGAKTYLVSVVPAL